VEAFETIETFGKEQAKGRGIKQALAKAFLGATTAEGTQWQSTIDVLATELEKVYQARGKEMDEKVVAYNRFVKADPRERLRLLLEDEAIRQEMLGTEQAGKAALIKPEVVKQRTQQIADAQREDLAAKQLQQIRASAAGREVAAEQDIAVEGEAKDIELGPGEARRKRLLKKVTQATKELSPERMMAHRGAVTRATAYGRWYTGLSSLLSAGDREAMKRFGVDPVKDARQAIEQSGFEQRTQAGLSVAMRRGALTPTQVKEFIGREQQVRGDVVPQTREAPSEVQKSALAPAGQMMGMEFGRVGMRATRAVGGGTQEQPVPIVVNAGADNREVVHELRKLNKNVVDLKEDGRTGTLTPQPANVAPSKRAQQLAELEAVD